MLIKSQYQRLTDPQWEVIKESLPLQRKRKYSLQDVVDAISCCLRLGNQWRNLPRECFPNWQLVYYYFLKWQADGTLGNLNWELNRWERKRRERRLHPA